MIIGFLVYSLSLYLLTVSGLLCLNWRWKFVDWLIEVLLFVDCFRNIYCVFVVLDFKFYETLYCCVSKEGQRVDSWLMDMLSEVIDVFRIERVEVFAKRREARVFTLLRSFEDSHVTFGSYRLQGSSRGKNRERHENDWILMSKKPSCQDRNWNIEPSSRQHRTEPEETSKKDRKNLN